MRFLIVDTDYSEFLEWFYSAHRGLARRCYAEQMRIRADSLFGHSDFFADNLRGLGHEAWSIHANNAFIQAAWAREHDIKHWEWDVRLRRGIVPWISRTVTRHRLDAILAAQIKHYKPDVLVNRSMHWPNSVFREVKSHLHLLIGMHAAPLPRERDFGAYDLVLSCVDNFVDYFRGLGLRSERLRLGFEATILTRLGEAQRKVPISFVGNVSVDHTSRLQWLEYVCQRAPVDVWMPFPNELPGHSPINRRRRGTAWGRGMYEVLQGSQMTLNHHIDVADEYAGNLRLFEATGVGALLVTDWKKNLHEMFEPGREVVAYRTPEECVELIRHYLDHEDERQTIARAGQERTLRDHTFYHRMQELASIALKYL